MKIPISKAKETDYSYFINAFHQHKQLRFSKKNASALVNIVIKEEGKIPQSINIVFVDDATMKLLHKRYLYSKQTTDVITFRLNKGKNIDGEIYVCLDQARRQSYEFNQTFSQEVARLIVHGSLHLVGYNDATNRQRSQMTKKEDFYLNQFYQHQN